MTTEQDNSIIDFSESVLQMDRCIHDFGRAQERMTAIALDSWDSVQIKAAVIKIQECGLNLSTSLDVSYGKLHAARIKAGIREGKGPASDL